MSITSAEIETIVRVALQRLREINAQSADTAAAATIPQIGLAPISSTAEAPGKQIKLDSIGSAVTNAVADSKTYAVDQRLVTLEVLRDRLTDIETLQVPAKAIVTPAVKDELRDRKIKLLRVEQQTSSAPPKSDSRLLVLANASLQNQFARFGEFAALTENSKADVCRISAHLNSGGTAALWNTTTPYAAARAAAQNASLHSIQLARLSEFDRAIREADPNVIVIDSSNWNVEQTAELASAWLGRLS